MQTQHVFELYRDGRHRMIESKQRHLTILVKQLPKITCFNIKFVPLNTYKSLAFSLQSLVFMKRKKLRKPSVFCFFDVRWKNLLKETIIRST